MIAIDTNILLRHLAQDHPEQSRAASKLVNSLSPANPGWISLVVLAEVVWTLKRTYKLEKSLILNVLDRFLSSRDLVLEEVDRVHHALSLYRTSAAGFADCLLLASAKATGCSKVATFDKIAARDLGMELIGA